MLSPLTNTSNTERIRRLSPGAIALRWRQELGIEVGDGFERLPGIEHWRCLDTGLEWYTPAEAAGGDSLYAQLQRFDWYYMPAKWEFRVALSHLASGDRVCEVGSGVGHFLAAARERSIEASGLELNPAAASIARANGFNVYQQELASLAREEPSSFDAVCAFQVLEHVPNPRVLVDEMLGLVRTGGQIILSVPNAAILRRIDPDHQGLLDQPPHHLSHWDERTFRSLERWLPVRVKHVQREPLQPYHVSWFVSSFAGRLRKGAGPVVGSLLFNRVSMAVARTLLNLGLRRWVPGHTLLVVLVKTA